MMSRIEVKNPPPASETRSYRLEAADGPGARRVRFLRPSDGFDPIWRGAGARCRRPIPSSPAKAVLPRQRSMTSAARGLPARGGRRAIPTCRRPSPGEGAAGRRAPAGISRSIERWPAQRRPPAGSDGGRGNTAACRHVVPRGTLISVYLLTTVDTSNPSAVLQFAAARSLFFHHRRQISFGTRFLGKLSGPPLRDRLNLAVGTVLYPDGRERRRSARRPWRPMKAAATSGPGSRRPIFHHRPGCSWRLIFPTWLPATSACWRLPRPAAAFVVGLGGLEACRRPTPRPNRAPPLIRPRRKRCRISPSRGSRSWGSATPAITWFPPARPAGCSWKQIWT